MGYGTIWIGYGQKNWQKLYISLGAETTGRIFTHTFIDVDILERSHELGGSILLSYLFLFLLGRLPFNMLQINCLRLLFFPKNEKRC